MYPGQRTAGGNPMLHDYATPQFGGAGVASFPDGRVRFVDRTMPRPAIPAMDARRYMAERYSGLEGLPAAPGTRPIAQAPISRQAPAGAAMPPSQGMDNPFLRATGMRLNSSLPAPDYNRRLSAMMAKFNRMSGGGMMPAMGMGGQMNMQTEGIAGGMQLADMNNRALQARQADLLANAQAMQTGRFGHEQELLKQKNALDIAKLQAEREGSVPEATKLRAEMLIKMAGMENLPPAQQAALLGEAYSQLPGSGGAQAANPLAGLANQSLSNIPADVRARVFDAQNQGKGADEIMGMLGELTPQQRQAVLAHISPQPGTTWFRPSMRNPSGSLFGGVKPRGLKEAWNAALMATPFGSLRPNPYRNRVLSELEQ